jgi:beta-lactamase superfamily II metal-dependent hydrolase
MAWEIDFLAVGEGEKSGDAIAFRFGNLANPQEQSVLVLDGGTKASGAKLVNHIKTFYKTSVVNAAICTHSDADHASGLTEVLENLNVQHLFMHLPWNHVRDLEEQLTKASPTDNIRQHFKKSLECAHELEKLAKKKSIPITEPFSDALNANAVLAVLGPSTSYYESLLESFRCADELDLAAGRQLLERVAARVEKAIKWIAETWDAETLVEPDEDSCSAENNSSVILLFTQGNDRFLFTSDARVPALTNAADHAQGLGIDLKTVTRLQIPHHGSKHNVGPKILDRIIGPKLKENTPTTKNAIVSAAPEAVKHPSKRVVNAFIRRGAKVVATRGNGICFHSSDVPTREGWVNATPLPFSNQVEEE